MFKNVLATVLAGLCLMLMVGTVGATTLTTNISMDNGFYAYLSTDDSIAGNEFSSANDWYNSYSATVSLTAGTDYYLHVLGYDQGGVAGFLGEFSLSGVDHQFSNNLQTLLTDTSNWSGNNTGWGNAYIAMVNLGAYGASPWSTKTGIDIDSDARWIWAGDARNDDISYFSTKISAASPVPEPSTIILLGGGLIGLAWCGRKHKKG